jgi:hypothetical protein
MHKKITALFLGAVMLCILLTGCIETGINVRIDPNGGGEVTTMILIEKSFFNMMTSMGESTVSSEVTRGETTVDGTEYVTLSQTKSYRTYTELERALAEMTYIGDGETDSEYIFKSVSIANDGDTYTFRAVTKAQEADEEMAESGMDFSDIYKLRLEITMPGEITESKGGEVNGVTLISDISDLSLENEVYVHSTSPSQNADDNESNFTAVVTGVILVVVILIAIVFLIFRSRRGY